MLNYRLDKEKSKTFVKFYEKDGDTLRIHYGNNTTHIVQDTSDTRKKLNDIMETQVSDEDTKAYLKGVKDNIDGLGISSVMFPTLAFFIDGMIYAIQTSTKFICTAISGGLCVINFAEFIHYKNIIKDHKKNELYLKYKNEIQEYLTCDEESNDLNIKQPREVLSINDVHFMSYKEIKDMTKNIAYILDEMETDKKRDEALGISREKVLFRQRTREFKRK